MVEWILKLKGEYTLFVKISGMDSRAFFGHVSGCIYLHHQDSQTLVMSYYEN